MKYLLIFFIINSSYGIVKQSDLDTYSCNGGGYDYKSDTVIEKYKYSKFISEYPKCNKIVETKTDGLSFVENHNKILNFAIENNSVETCSEIVPLIEKYKIQTEDVKKFIDKVTIKRNDNIFKNSTKLDSNFDKVFMTDDQSKYSQEFQLRSISLANTAVLCGVSDTSLKVSPLWKLKVGLLEEPISAGTEIIGESGQTTESCLNVQATGSEDLKNFFVTVKHADTNVPLSIKYETYSAKDRVVLSLDGEQVFDSGCVGENKELQVPLKDGSEKLKVEVFAKCAGASGTSWKIGITCKEAEKEPEPKTGACLAQISELVSYVDQGIFLSRGILKHYWMKSNCYGEYYEKVKGELVDLTKLVKSHSINKCTNKECSKNIDQKYFKGLSFKDPQKTEGFSPISKEQVSSKSNLLENGKVSKKSRNNKEKFLNQKGWFKDKTVFRNNSALKSTSITDKSVHLSNVNKSVERIDESSKLKEDNLELKDTKKKYHKDNLVTFKNKKISVKSTKNEITGTTNPVKEFVSAESSKAIVNIKNKEEFLKNKYKYCINNQQIPRLFAVVSFRYCLSGFPELLEFSDL